MAEPATQKRKKVAIPMYRDLVPVLEQVYKDYSRDVKEHIYPGTEHTDFMKEEELAWCKDMVG